MNRAEGTIIAAMLGAIALGGCGAAQNSGDLPPCPGAAPAAERSEPVTGLAQLYFEARRSMRPVRPLAGEEGEPGTMAEGALLMPVFEQTIELLLRAVVYEAVLPGRNDLPGPLAQALETAWLGMGALTCELGGDRAVVARERAIGQVARDLARIPGTARLVLTTAVDSGALIEGAPASEDLCFLHRLRAFDQWADFAEHLDDLVAATAPLAAPQATEADIAAGDAPAFTPDDAARLRLQADAAWAALELFGSFDASAETLRAQLPLLAGPRPVDAEPLTALTSAVDSVAQACGGDGHGVRDGVSPAPRTGASPAR